MKTWHTTYLDPPTRILVHDGLLVEYAPGCVLEADLARYKEFRAASIAQLLSPNYIAISRTALWIYTAFLYQDCMPRLCAAHPTSSQPHVLSRRTIREECCHTISDLRLTNPACTAVDLLLLETPERARLGIQTLYDADLLTPQEVSEHLNKESARNGSRKARATFQYLQASGQL